MKVKFKRFDKNLGSPEYKTLGAAAFDLTVRETTVIAAQTVQLIPLNVAVEIPQGYWLLLAVRSSAHKLGIMAVNGIGIIDSDYCGDNDELKLAAWNYTQKEITIEKGVRIAQGVVVKKESIELAEVEKLGNSDRGGFGTTGNVG